MLDSADAWILWYQDTFDWDAAPQIELRGDGLQAGLLELWARYLFETVQANGKKGFSTFFLQSQRGRIEIQGDWPGAVRLRQWMFGEKSSSYTGYVDAADRELLAQVTQAHLSLLNRQQTAEPLLKQAAIAANLDDFLDQLKNRFP